MDLVGVREELLEDPSPGGTHPTETVRRWGVATGAPAPVYFADEAGPSGTAGGGGMDDAAEAKRLQEAYDVAAKAQETQLVWDELDHTLNKLGEAEEAACQGKKVRRGRKGRDLVCDIEPTPRLNVRVLPDEYAQMFTTAGVEEVPEATLASDNDDPLAPPPPKAEARQTLDQMSIPEIFIYEASAAMGSDLMDRHIPYHEPKPRKPKPQAKEPQKSEAVEKVRAQRQARGRVGTAQKTGVGSAKKRAPAVKRKVRERSESDDSDSESGDSIDDFIDDSGQQPQEDGVEEAPPQDEDGSDEEEFLTPTGGSPSPADVEMGTGPDDATRSPPADADASQDQDMEAADAPAEGQTQPEEGEAGQDEEMEAADQPAQGGASGGDDPGEEPPDPDKPKSPPEAEAQPEEEDEEEDDEQAGAEPENLERAIVVYTGGGEGAQERGGGEPTGEREETALGAPSRETIPRLPDFWIFSLDPRERGRGEMESHLSQLAAGFLRDPSNPYQTTLITPNWRLHRPDRKKGPQWNEFKDNELHGYLNYWAHALLEYRRAFRKGQAEGLDERTLAWYDFVAMALIRVGEDLLGLFEQRREAKSPQRPDFSDMIRCVTRLQLRPLGSQATVEVGPNPDQELNRGRNGQCGPVREMPLDRWRTQALDYYGTGLVHTFLKKKRVDMDNDPPYALQYKL